MKVKVEGSVLDLMLILPLVCQMGKGKVTDTLNISENDSPSMFYEEFAN